ncbi:hypothetical protein P4S65_15195 [Pseudoalteromonas sp. B131b]|nr:UPF0755 protein [Pseudoalteromonas sp. BSi20495]
MLKVILSVLFLAVITTAVGYQQLQATINSPLKVAQNTQFEVKHGTGFNKLCHQWQAKNWVESCWRYQVIAKLDPTLTDLKAGLYELTADSVISNIKKLIKASKSVLVLPLLKGKTYVKY